MREHPLAREGLGGEVARAEPDQPSRSLLRDPQAAALLAGERGDAQVSIVLEQRRQIACEVGDRRLRLGRGESVFVPRTVAHAWASRGEVPATVLEVYRPAGRLEQFFREVGKYSDPPIHEALSIDEMKQLFAAHGMRLLGPGLGYSD